MLPRRGAEFAFLMIEYQQSVAGTSLPIRVADRFGITCREGPIDHEDATLTFVVPRTCNREESATYIAHHELPESPINEMLPARRTSWLLAEGGGCLTLLLAAW